MNSSYAFIHMFFKSREFINIIMAEGRAEWFIEEAGWMSGFTLGIIVRGEWFLCLLLLKALHVDWC